MKTTVLDVQTAFEQVAEMRKEMQRLERRARDLEGNLRATAKKRPLVIHPEGNSRPKTPPFVLSKDVHPLKTDPGLAERVQRAMDLETRRETEIVVAIVVNALEQLLLSKLGIDGFAIKLGGFGKFKVRHVGPTRRKVGFSGKVVTTNAKKKIKFVALGSLRASETEQQNSGN